MSKNPFNQCSQSYSLSLSILWAGTFFFLIQMSAILPFVLFCNLVLARVFLRSVWMEFFPFSDTSQYNVCTYRILYIRSPLTRSSVVFSPVAITEAGPWALLYMRPLHHSSIRWLSGKESACQCRRCQFSPWVGKIPWRRKWQSTPVFFPGKSHGQRSLAGCSPRGPKDLDTS